MSIAAKDIAAALEAHVDRIEGDPDRMLAAVTPISQPQAGALSYIRPNVSNLSAIAKQITGMGIICAPIHAEALSTGDVTCLVTNSPRLVFMRAVQRFFSLPKPPAGVHPSAVVAPSATIDPTASIGASCVVGDGCWIGARSILYPNVTLMSDVRVGADVVINSGTVIGADGFGYERNEDFELEKFPHVGGVEIEDNVEIGSNTSIDRGTLGATVIRTGARIDNQCHISHNVEIGRHAAVIAQSMVGGSAKIRDYAWLAPSAIIINQAQIGTRATVGIGSVVVKDVPDHTTVMGSPAVSADDFRAQRAAIKKLLG